MIKKSLFIAAAILLAGCEGIGDGNTLKSLEVRPAGGSAVTGSYALYECIREQLVVLGTFTDGSVADMSFRATWTSSDPSVVEVSDGETDLPFVDDGAFTTNDNVNLSPGTVIPHAATATPVTITAEFLGIRASLGVTVGNASFVISPAPDTTLTPAQPTHLGVGTVQRFNLLVRRGGRVTTGIAANQFGPGSINPLLWRFAGSNAAFDPRDADDASDFDKYTVSNGGDDVASVNTLTGTVTGLKADAGAYPVEVELSLCPGSSGNPIPAADVRVAEFAGNNPLTIAREAGFGADLALHTNQLLSATAALDTDNDGDGDATQNLSHQARFGLEPRNATCDAEGLNCAANEHLFFFPFTNDLRTTGAATAGSGTAQACFPSCVPTLASLSADRPAPGVGESVTFTAAAVNLTPGVTGASYEFDFGDGSAAVTQSGPAITHSYADEGLYTATVRVTDSDGVLAQNAGGVQIRVGDAAAGNTAPSAGLTASPGSGNAPLTVLLNAASSLDGNAGDEITVYEFDFGDGTPVVRQTTPTVSHVFLSRPTVAPSVTVYDESGATGTASLALNDAGEIQPNVTGTVPASRFVRSNLLDFTAVPATLTSFTISPDTAAEPAFTYPGRQFEAFGTFEATAPATFSGGGASDVQNITRFIGWAARPAADSTAFSDIAFVRTASDDLLKIGQVGYFKNVDSDTDVFITGAPPVSPFATVAAPTPAVLTVQECLPPVCP